MLKPNTLFEVKQAFITRGVEELQNQELINGLDILSMLKKHMCNVDDNEFEEDREYNLRAIKNGFGRVFSVYNIGDEKIYIVSYLDKNLVSEETTIMLSEEY